MATQKEWINDLADFDSDVSPPQTRVSQPRVGTFQGSTGRPAGVPVGMPVGHSGSISRGTPLTRPGSVIGTPNRGGEIPKTNPDPRGGPNNVIPPNTVNPPLYPNPNVRPTLNTSPTIGPQLTNPRPNPQPNPIGNNQPQFNPNPQVRPNLVRGPTGAGSFIGGQPVGPLPPGVGRGISNPINPNPNPNPPALNPNPTPPVIPTLNTPPNGQPLSNSGGKSGSKVIPRSSSSPRPQQILASKQRPGGPEFNPLGTVVLPKQKKPAHIVKFDPKDIVRDKPKLAKGSFGVIYTGHVKGIKEKVVIKDMTNVYPESVEEWKNEIEVMSNNSCDFVCKIFGHCEDGETLSLIVEYMPKGDLFCILHKNPQLHPLSILQRMRMARQTAYGLTFLHSNGLMHRDMKSLNILVTDDYSCKLADFGTAKLVTQAQALNTANVGSPLWMAPEVRNGVYGFPADVYSLGLILYEIFSGKMPHFNPTTMTTTLPQQFSYSKLILPCIDRDPTKRPTSFQIGQMLDTMISSIVVSVLNSMKQPGSKPVPESTVDKLCNACWNNDLPLVKTLLNAGNINDKNTRGQCPLYCAARTGSVDVLVELLNFGGIHVDMQVPEHGGTPLHAASFADHVDVVALLLAKGATSSIANLKGLSARQEAKSKAQDAYSIYEKNGLEKLKKVYPVVNRLTACGREQVIHKPEPKEGVPFPELADLEGPQRLEVIYKYILSLPPAEAEALINNAFKIQMMK